ncbi:MAG TPA: sigma-54 dependent transcriptional regulator [Fulvivirga sp.]|nr:sigma-54 dependent transcriptional regulator [Fulvivirga sp.]
MKKILIIDDDQDICQLLKRFLNKNNYEANYVQNGADGMKFIKKQPQDLILCDYKLPDATGVELLQKIKVINPHAAVIIITGYSDVRIAVETLKHGAYDYVTKPLYPDEILLTIKSALESSTEVSQSSSRAQSKRSNTKEFISGKSPQAELVQKHIELIAPTDMSVIISGETGTGKEFVANAIHQKSKRADKPFIAIDCGAIPKELAGSELFGHLKGSFTGALSDKKGSFEMADGGTLFLDEIGNLSYDNQVKLLRVLQERKIKRIGSNSDTAIDVRVIVATNEDLKNAVEEHRFREDIYHRLNEFKIELAPLRERKSDIDLFSKHFLQLANHSLDKNVEGFDEQALDRIKNYYWHGNFRELQNVIKRAVLLCQDTLIGLEHLPEEIVNPDSFDDQLSEDISFLSDNEDLKSASEIAERNVIINTLKKEGYNKSKTAKALKIDRKTLYNKLKAYNINL